MAATHFSPNNVRAVAGVTLSAATPETTVEGPLHVEVFAAGAYTRAIDNQNQGGAWQAAPIGAVDLADGECRAWRFMGSQVPIRIVPV